MAKQHKGRARALGPSSQTPSEHAARNKIRRWARLVARTPLHPQWLSGSRRIPEGLTQITGSLLDIGAANRWVEPHLNPRSNYIALDYPATGSEMYGASPHVFADAAHLPFQKNQFDSVLCLEVLEHVPDPARVMQEISRVLKPGGRAWLSMPFLYPLHDAPYDFQRYTEYGLRRDAERSGLEVLTLSQSGHAIRSAGLLMCLAIAGGAVTQRGWKRLFLFPLTALAVLLINIGALLLSLVWPDWSHLSKGHDLMVCKPTFE